MDLGQYRKENSSFSSPYLNFDPSILRPVVLFKNGASNFVIPEGQTEHRGKMEMSFLRIGGAVCVGGAFGGLNGFYSGLRETHGVALPVRKTMMLNIIGKQGSRSSQAFGSIALLFSLYETIFTQLRGVDDELNCLPAGAFTGLTYSITSGLRTITKSSLVGLGASLVYLSIINKEFIFNHLPNVFSVNNNNNKY